jgi:putative ABC transport system permease protein
MDWKGRIAHALHGRKAPDDDVLEELAQHAASIHEAARAEGCSADEATVRVDAQIAAWSRDASILARRHRHTSTPPPPPARLSSGLGPLASSWFSDIRHAVRLLAREPAYALLVIGTMALGISAVTVLLGVAYGVLLKPLPWADSDRVVRVVESRQGGAPRVAGTVSNGTYLAWRERSQTIEEVGGWMSNTMTLTGAGEPERLAVARSTPSLFSVLDAHPALGRLLVRDDEAAKNAVLLSHGLWRDRFGSRSDIIGRTITLDRTPYVVVGVMPGDFTFPDRESRAWIPFAVPAVVGEEGARRMAIFRALARLRPGVTPAQAAAEATSRARSAPDPGLAAVALFGSSGPADVSIVPALEAMTADIRPAITLLLAAGALLLATAIGNVASLQLARATRRRREFAIRSAIGAGSARLGRQVAVESIVLGLAGGVTALGFARVMLMALPRIVPADFPRLDAIALDAPVLVLALAASVASGAACAFLPALQARRVNLVESLAEDSLAPVGGGMRSPTARTRALIMVGQVAVACVLLVGAALLARSLVSLQRADRGYDPANLLTGRIPLPSTYPLERRNQLLEAIVQRLGGVAGVEHAAYANAAPLISTGGYAAFTMRSPRRADAEISVEAAQRVVSPDYFKALRLRVTEGRPLTDEDTAGSRPVIVVNRSFAERYLGERPVGARIPWHGPRGGLRLRNDAQGWEVVGIVEDVRQGAVDAPRQPEIIAAYAQVEPETIRAFDPIVIVRTAGDPAKLVRVLGDLVREQDGSLALDSVMSMEERIATSLERPRTYAALVGGFAVFAVLIAAVGLFGVLAYTVTLRSREIGVRSALGASPRAIVLLVLRQAAWVTSAGLAAGLAAAYAAGKSIAAFLYGVRPHDPVSFAAVAALLLVVAALASIVPARRAASVDPLTVLK